MNRIKKNKTIRLYQQSLVLHDFSSGEDVEFFFEEVNYPVLYEYLGVLENDENSDIQQKEALQKLREKYKEVPFLQEVEKIFESYDMLFENVIQENDMYYKSALLLDREFPNRSMRGNLDQLNDQQCVIVGVGTVGNGIIKLLQEIGVDKIKLVDYDFVERKNILSQICFDEADIGQKKIEVIQAKTAKEIRNHLQVYDYKVEDAEAFFTHIDIQPKSHIFLAYDEFDLSEYHMLIEKALEKECTVYVNGYSGNHCIVECFRTHEEFYESDFVQEIVSPEKTISANANGLESGFVTAMLAVAAFKENVLSEEQPPRKKVVNLKDIKKINHTFLFDTEANIKYKIQKLYAEFLVTKNEEVKLEVQKLDCLLSESIVEFDENQGIELFDGDHKETIMNKLKYDAEYMKQNYDVMREYGYAQFEKVLAQIQRQTLDTNNEIFDHFLHLQTRFNEKFMYHTVIDYMSVYEVMAVDEITDVIALSEVYLPDYIQEHYQFLKEHRFITIQKNEIPFGETILYDRFGVSEVIADIRTNLEDVFVIVHELGHSFFLGYLNIKYNAHFQDDHFLQEVLAVLVEITFIQKAVQTRSQKVQTLLKNKLDSWLNGLFSLSQYYRFLYSKGHFDFEELPEIRSEFLQEIYRHCEFENEAFSTYNFLFSEDFYVQNQRDYLEIILIAAGLTRRDNVQDEIGAYLAENVCISKKGLFDFLGLTEKSVRDEGVIALSNLIDLME